MSTTCVVKLPLDVTADLANGFVMTDIDDRFQRCLIISDNEFEYRSGTDDQTFLCGLSMERRGFLEHVVAEVIDLSELEDHTIEDIANGYSGKYEDFEPECYEDSVTLNMRMAERYFEMECDIDR
jgi:hypothetical protein